MSFVFRNLELEFETRIDTILKEYQGVMVAHSGGLDSTALLRLFSRFSKEKKFFNLSVFHMNFGLRGKESELDQRFSQDLASDLGLAFFTETISAECRQNKVGESTQEWARRLRHQAFEKHAKDGWLIATGHTLNDLAENVIFRLSRGTSVAGLTGMSVFDPPIWRPLLTTKRADLEAWTGEQRLPHREDATNDTLIYSRNVIRHEVLPHLETLYPGASERLVATAREAVELQSEYRSLVIDRVPKETNDEESSVLLSDLEKLSDIGIATVLGDLINDRHRQLDRSFFTDMVSGIRCGFTTSRGLPEGGRIRIANGRLVYEQTNQGSAPRINQHARSLELRDFCLRLGPGSYGSLSTSEGLLEIRSSLDRTAEVTGRGFRGSESVTIAGRTVKLKTLMQDWQIPTNQRNRALIIAIDGVDVGISLGKGVLWGSNTPIDCGFEISF